MLGMGTKELTPAAFKEWRRCRALTLKQRGWTQAAIAEALGVTPGAVSQWLTAARRGGPDALRARPATGRPPKLAPDRLRRLPELLWEGPEAHGFRGEVWTCARAAKAIEREFGVRYHKDHVGRLLKGLGWTPQVPATRAVQRDEQAIERWRAEVWPELKKRPAGSGGSCCSWTRPASTCCRGWCGPTARRA
jgi:transposase